MIIVFISEHISILKQLLHFSSCHVFEIYPGFETITRIHINVNVQVFMHLRSKTRYFDKGKKNKIENKKHILPL